MKSVNADRINQFLTRITTIEIEIVKPFNRRVAKIDVFETYIETRLLVYRNGNLQKIKHVFGKLFVILLKDIILNYIRN